MKRQAPRSNNKIGYITITRDNNIKIVISNIDFGGMGIMNMESDPENTISSRMETI